MSPPTYAPCAEHTEALASFRCDGCLRYLCYDCVDESQRLKRCRHCGEQAHFLEETSEPSPEEAPAVGLPPMDILYSERTASRKPVKMADDPLTQIFNHIVVPAATIVMVASFLFFLLDVRSVFSAYSANLKWLGFWFVFATVLIARYGKSAGQSDRVGCYSLGLTVATFLAISLGPWQRQDPSWQGPLFNGLILLAVWRFATAVTSGLALEGEEKERVGQRLYGLERLTMEAFQRHRKGRPLNKKPIEARSERSILPTSRAPNKAVARLAAMVMVVFAVGEPALLKGPPEVATRGFASMVAFLLACGVILGAGAALDVFRRVRDAGGKISATLVPRRMLAATVSVVLLLSIALGMPGVQLQGQNQASNARQRAVDDAARQGSDQAGDETGDDEGSAGKTKPSEKAGKTLETSAGDPQRPQSPSSQEPSEGEANPLRLSGTFLSFLATLGRWLRYPALLVGVIIALVALRRLLPLLGGWRGFGGALGSFLARFGALFRRRSPKTPKIRRRLDPWKGIEGLQNLDPEQAIRRAYGHLLMLLEALDYPRLQDRTPHEVLASLPRRCQDLQPAAARLTELYVAAAYGPDEVSNEDRQRALDQLALLRRQSEALIPST